MIKQIEWFWGMHNWRIVKSLPQFWAKSLFSFSHENYLRLCASILLIITYYFLLLLASVYFETLGQVHLWIGYISLHFLGCVLIQKVVMRVIDKIKGPNPSGTENWCGLQDPLQNMPKGGHQQDPEAPSHRAQKGPEIRGGSPIDGGWTCNERGSHHQVERCKSGQSCPTVPAEMCLISLVDFFTMGWDS